MGTVLKHERRDKRVSSCSVSCRIIGFLSVKLTFFLHLKLHYFTVKFTIILYIICAKNFTVMIGKIFSIEFCEIFSSYTVFLNHFSQ